MLAPFLRRLPLASVALLLATVVHAAELRVATLNCFLLFDPRLDHRGKVDDEERMTLGQYQEKLTNLSTLLRGYQAVGVQETGGQVELAALAERAGMRWLWERGNDTATGQEVGFLYQLPGWTVASRGRVRELDRLVSKHLLVEARQGAHRVLFLVIHLLRPIGNQSIKHKQQVAAIGDWMRAQAAADAKTAIVVLGDTNSTLTERGTSLFGLGLEAGEKIGFRATHLAAKAFDRLVLLGPASWRAVEVRTPPYGSRPAAALKRVWSDHYLLGAELVFTP
jgi:hypothetical protein